MTEQIVDLIEGVMPGPQGLTGPQGERGLPGVDAVPADEAVAAYIAAADSQTGMLLDDKFALRDKRDSIVVIGDSMSVVNNNVVGTRWHEQLAKRLGLVDHNYAVAGQSLTNGQYQAQVDKAVADTTFDHKKVKYVFISGSTNEPSYDYAKYAAQMGAIDEKVRLSFPNAELIALNFLYFFNVRYVNNGASSDQRPQNFARQIQFFGRVFAEYKWTVIDCDNWFKYAPDMHKGDELHPSVEGCTRLANMVYGVLHDGVTPSNTMHFADVNAVNCSFTKAQVDADPGLTRPGIPTGVDLKAFTDLWAGYSQSWYNYTLQPHNDAMSLVAYGLLKINKEQALKWKTNSDNTNFFGFEFPFLVKPWPIPWNYSQNDFWTEPIEPFTLSNGVALNTRINYTKKTDTRLPVPDDARKYIYVRFDCIIDPASYSASPQLKPYNIGHILDQNPSDTFTFGWKIRLNFPLDAMYL